MKVNIPASTGELFDKITILEIKMQKIRDNEKIVQVKKELKLLKEVVKKKKLKTRKISLITKKLKAVNLKLWNVEDKLRKLEKNKIFNKEFIKQARNVYFSNDKRASLKNEINLISNSKIIEVKSYEKY
tara:strand:- start:674 stop:1060 length:387 start_codon:yes stop_codon:yes gene_type:complete